MIEPVVVLAEEEEEEEVVVELEQTTHVSEYYYCLVVVVVDDDEDHENDVAVFVELIQEMDSLSFELMKDVVVDLISSFNMIRKFIQIINHIF